MKFAKTVFWVAGIWGFLVLTPLYFLSDFIGKQTPPPLTHPEFYYSFIGVALVWQVAFLVIAFDPARFRPFMVVAILEKASYVLTLVVLFVAGHLVQAQAWPAVPDAVLGVLFIAAYQKTSSVNPLVDQSC